MNCLAQRIGNMNVQDYVNNRGYDEIPQRPIDRLKPLRDDVNKRQNTFKTFPKNAQVKAEDLLADGFFYIGDGENDRVQCAYCGGIFKNWHKNDNVHEEHKRIFDRCPLVNRGAPFLSFGDSNPANFSNQNRTDGGQIQLDGPASHGAIDITSDDLEADCAPVEKYPKHPNYSLKSVRLNTFKNWPENMNQKPDDLAEAGLFYAGEKDKAWCYYCGGALVEWEPEDIPAPEHDNWFPDCLLAQKRKSGK